MSYNFYIVLTYLLLNRYMIAVNCFGASHISLFQVKDSEHCYVFGFNEYPDARIISKLLI